MYQLKPRRQQHRFVIANIKSEPTILKEIFKTIIIKL
jgi:hypothetical protein